MDGIHIGGSTVSGAKSIPITQKNFMDFYFRHYIRSHYDTNQDGKLNEKERNAVTEIDVGEVSEYQLDLEYPSPGAMDGIEFFPNLKKLDCSYCGLNELDVSANKKLEELDCSDNYLKELDVKKNKKLKVLYCSDNKLKKIDVSQNTNMEIFYCSNNKLKKLNVSKNTKLKVLYCYNNKLKKVNLDKNRKIYDLLVARNMLTTLELNKLSNLRELCCGENELKKLDVTHNKKLSLLECHTNKLTTLDVSKNKDLDYLHCGNNRIRKLDLSKNRLLQTFRCEGNRLITGNVKLSRTQLERCEAATQKATIKRKKIGKYYYIPLPGVVSTNVISNLSYGKITSRGIRVKKSGMPKTITYEYNMFTDGEEKTTVTIRTKK